MFEVRKPKGPLSRTFIFFELLYHSIVRNMRSSGGSNAILGLFKPIIQTLIFILIFYAMFSLIGSRGPALRGDYLLYIMTGIFMFIVHTMAVNAVGGADGPTSPMMQHAPMNTLLSLCATALTSLYTQVLTIVVILFSYHVLFNPVVIYQPIPSMGMVILAWASGCAVGMLFLAIAPWLPGVATIGKTLYTRLCMIASGKMFVANTLPNFMISLFDWNPLFHVVDQLRGYVFINYNPHKSSLMYPLYLTIAFIMIGLILGHYATKGTPTNVKKHAR